MDAITPLQAGVTGSVRLENPEVEKVEPQSQDTEYRRRPGWAPSKFRSVTKTAVPPLQPQAFPSTNTISLSLVPTCSETAPRCQCSPLSSLKTMQLLPDQEAGAEDDSPLVKVLCELEMEEAVSLAETMECWSHMYGSSRRLLWSAVIPWPTLGFFATDGRPMSF
eukprot:TRINITY_DN94041_c0_g1_i1.p2 TRINITY_DN94041_c0_g1~~TRINITY_DN94041_c0_g1_i1.p2  ORF type:complete len:165 (-),score=9.77 TRINITY_DN94041_c0_g1_i1:435-929(-)